MALRAAMWVPGNVALVEFPERLTARPPISQPAGLPGLAPIRETRILGATVTFSQVYQGQGADFNWFHFPIPTPVILDDARTLLSKFFVFFHTQLSRVSAAHLWDGPRRVWERDHLDLEGDHSTGIDGANEFQLEPAMPVFFGLGIALRVDVLPEELAQPQIRSLVTFTSAGADFTTT